MPVLVIADGQGSGAALVEEGRILAAAKQHRWASCYAWSNEACLSAISLRLPG